MEATYLNYGFCVNCGSIIPEEICLCKACAELSKTGKITKRAIWTYDINVDPEGYTEEKGREALDDLLNSEVGK